MYVQEPTLSDMTGYELTFSLKVESMLGCLPQPQRRQIKLEVQ